MKRIALLIAPGYQEQMHSQKPVGLHTLCGKTLLEHVTDTLGAAGLTATLVLSEEDRAQVLEAMVEVPCVAAPSETEGIAATVASLDAQGGCVLITSAARPFVTAESCRALLRAVEEENCAAAMLCDTRTDESAAYCFRADVLAQALPRVKEKGTAQADALREVVQLLLSEGCRVHTVCAQDGECLHVNHRAALAKAAEQMRRRINGELMESGVTLIDPERVYVDCGVRVGRDTVIYPGCILETGTTIGEGCTLYANCRLNHAQIGREVTIESSVILEASVADRTTVGPYAYIRPHTSVGEGCRIGDFVELKNSRIGNGTKVSHLTYVGDSDLGEKINLGCGVVFVNYDGKKKQRSTVGDHAFIGCNVNLVAPVNVGRDAYIAAGSTVTCDVPEGAMLIARARESIKDGWVAARKESGKL